MEEIRVAKTAHDVVPDYDEVVTDPRGKVHWSLEHPAEYLPLHRLVATSPG